MNNLGFMNALTCIYMYCNIERYIMKNQFDSPGFGIQGKSRCTFVLCSSHFIFFCFKNLCAGKLCTGLKPTSPCLIFRLYSFFHRNNLLTKDLD